MFEFIETKNKDKETILIEMGVIDIRVIQRVDENESFQSPDDSQNEQNSMKIEKEVCLNSTGFNDTAIKLNEIGE